MSWPELLLQEQVEEGRHVKGFVFFAWLAAEIPLELWKERHRAAVGILTDLQCSLQGLGRGRETWNGIQRPKTSEHQEAYGDPQLVAFLRYQASTNLRMFSCWW